MNRRGFLTDIAGFLAAPAIVRVLSLMPVSPRPYCWLPDSTYEWIMIQGQTPHTYYETEATGWVMKRTTTAVAYWRASCMAHGGRDPLERPRY